MHLKRTVLACVPIIAGFGAEQVLAQLPTDQALTSVGGAGATFLEDSGGYLQTGGPAGIDVAVSQDGKTAFFSAKTRLTRVDLTTSPPTETGRVTLPDGLWWGNPSVELTSTGLALVTYESFNRDTPVLAVDTDSMTIVGTLYLGIDRSEAVDTTADGSLAVVASYLDHGLHFVDIAPDGSLTETGFVAGYLAGVNITISPNGHIAIVPGGTIGVDVYDLVTRTFVKTIDLHAHHTQGNQCVVFTPDGTKAYVYDGYGETGIGGGSISVLAIDGNDNVTDTGSRITDVYAMGNPTIYARDLLAITPDGSRLFVRAAYGFQVIDTATDTVLTPYVRFPQDTGFTPGIATGGGAASEPPVVSCGEAAVLWEPNHQLVDISEALFTIEDPDTPIEELAIDVVIVSDESELPETGDGTGRHAPDFKTQLASGADGFFVRSERSGPGDGRVYLAVVTVSDGENTVTHVCTVALVPHNQDNASLEAVASEAAALEAALQEAIDVNGAENVDLADFGLKQHGVSEELGPNQ